MILRSNDIFGAYKVILQMYLSFFPWSVRQGFDAVTSWVTRMHDTLNIFYFGRWLDSAKHFIELHSVLNNMIEVITYFFLSCDTK